jgi:hypothetical protein
LRGCVALLKRIEHEREQSGLDSDTVICELQRELA